MMPRIIEKSFIKIKQYKSLLWELTKTDLKLRYAGSVLGFIWVFLKPFATFTILFLVFSAFFGRDDPSYTLNLLIGLVIFYYFSEGTTQLIDALLKRSNIILRLNFPRIIVIWSSLLSSLANFCASLLFFFILVGTLFKSLYELNIHGILLFGVIIVFLSLSIIGFGLFASIIQVKFRDFQQIWALVLQLLLYATPIIYPLSILPLYLQKIIQLNPLTIIVDFSRHELLGSPLSVPASYIPILGIAIIAIDVIGYCYFKSRVKAIAEQI